MGRSPKTGLSFFKKSVHYYEDLKIMDLINEYGPLGNTIFDCLLCIVNRDGYYLNITLEKLTFVIMRTIGNKWIKDKCRILRVIDYCAEIGLIDKDLLAQNIITSVGIQKRYAEVTSRNKVDKSLYWLLDKEGEPLKTVPQNIISVTEKDIVVTEMSEFATEKSIRSKKIEGRKKKEESSATAINYNDIKEQFNLICTSFSKVQIITEPRKKALTNANKILSKGIYKTKSFKEFFELVENSNFLTGRTGKWKNCNFDWILKSENLIKILEGNYNNEKADSNSDCTYDIKDFDKLNVFDIKE